MERMPRIIAPIPQSMLDRIDDFQVSEDLPSRAEAIRRLIEIGLRIAEEGGWDEADGA